MIRESETPLREQAEKLAEVGARLKAAREAHDLSLADVSGKTKIQPRFLAAIEDGNLDELPAPVYTQGFIQRFAEVLGLNSGTLSLLFWDPPPSLHRPRDSQTSDSAWEPPLHLALIAAVLAMVAAVGLGVLSHRLIKPSPASETSQATISDSRS